MKKIAYIGVKFDPNEEHTEFVLNLPSTTKVASCKTLVRLKRTFVQLCYNYSSTTDNDADVHWKEFKFFIVKQNSEFDATGLTYIGVIKVYSNSTTFKVFYK